METGTTAAPLLGEPLPVELMNTIWADRDGVHDALDGPPATAAWMAAVAGRDDLVTEGLSDWLTRATPADVREIQGDLLRLRDAGRRLAARRTEDGREAALMPVTPSSALDTVNELAAAVPAWPLLSWPDGVGTPKATTVSAHDAGRTFISDVARATIELLSGPTGFELRACYAPGCVLYFVKHHPRREWCSAGCGNRARQARHYERHHGQG